MNKYSIILQEMEFYPRFLLANDALLRPEAPLDVLAFHHLHRVLVIQHHLPDNPFVLLPLYRQYPSIALILT